MAVAVIEVRLKPEISRVTKRSPVPTGIKKSTGISTLPDPVKRITFDSNKAPVLFCSSIMICPAAEAPIKTDFNLEGSVQLNTKYLPLLLVALVAVPETVAGPTVGGVTSLSTQ